MSEVGEILPNLQISYLGGVAFCGAIGVLIIFISILFINNRERLYFYYLLFLIFNFLMALLTLDRFDKASSFLNINQTFNYRAMEAVTLLALTAYCEFTLRLLDIPKQNEKLARWIQCLAGVTALYGVLYFILYPWIGEHRLRLFIVSRAVIMPMCFIAIIWVSYSTKSIFKGYFIIGSVFYFVGAFLAIIRDLSAEVPIQSFYAISSNFYFELGIFLEIILFSVALSHRISLGYRTREMEQKAIREKAVYEKNLAQAEMLASRLQINPHFIFNSLNAIKYLMQIEENAKAIKYLNIFSKFVRKVLEEGTQPLVPLEEEVELVRNYLLLEANRFDNDFKSKVMVDSRLNLQKYQVPPMLVLPYIDDAIWSRLLPYEGEQILEVSFKQEEDELHISIKDNGIVETSKSLRQRMSFHKNNGLLINKKRITLYNSNYKGELSVKQCGVFNENNNRVGTEVILILKD